MMNLKENAEELRKMLSGLQQLDLYMLQILDKMSSHVSRMPIVEKGDVNMCNQTVKLILDFKRRAAEDPLLVSERIKSLTAEEKGLLHRYLQSLEELKQK